MGSTYKGKKNDIWALGITLYYMSMKKYPFEGKNIPLLFRNIQNYEINFQNLPLSQGQIGFLERVLQKNPEFRAPIVDLKGHPWITNNGLEPMPQIDQQEIKVNEEDRMQVFTKANIIANVIMKMKKKAQDT